MMGMDTVTQSNAGTDNLLPDFDQSMQLRQVKSGEADSKAEEESPALVGDPPSVVQDGDVTVALQQSDLWKTFARSTNEMIVTRSGRRMFPVYAVTVSGLDPNAMYSVYLDFEVVGLQRWKFVNRKWAKGGRADPPIQSRYRHPDSPNYGAHWMGKAIQFSKIKLTNKSNTEQIVLNSLHNYEPCLLIKPEPGHSDGCQSAAVSFPQTQFIAVTAYQNEAITELKIAHNPFAKSFKDSVSRCKEEPSAHGNSDISAGAASHQQARVGNVKPNFEFAASHSVPAQQFSPPLFPTTTAPVSMKSESPGSVRSLPYYSHQPLQCSAPYPMPSAYGTSVPSSDSFPQMETYPSTIRTARAMSLPTPHHRPVIATMPMTTATHEHGIGLQKLVDSFRVRSHTDGHLMMSGTPYPAPPSYLQSTLPLSNHLQVPAHSPSNSPSPKNGCRRSKSTPSMSHPLRLHPYGSRTTPPATQDASPMSLSPMSLSPRLGSPEAVSPLISGQDFKFKPLNVASTAAELASSPYDCHSDSGSTHASFSKLSTMLEEADPGLSPAPPSFDSGFHLAVASANADPMSPSLSSLPIGTMPTSDNCHLTRGMSALTSTSPMLVMGSNPYVGDWSGLSVANGLCWNEL